MKPKIDTIQGLRAIAILYVVLFHTGNIFHFGIFSHGATGVSLFFVISGFIVAYTQKREGELSEALLFAKKRIARIYFPYIMPFVVMLFLFLISGKGNETHRDIVNIIRNLFLVHLPSHSIYPYSWTLVYEVYFYMTFGILVLIFQLNIFVYGVLMMVPFLFSLLPIGSGIITSDAVPFAFTNAFFVAGIFLSVIFDKIKTPFKNHFAILALAIFIVLPFWADNEILLLLCTALLFFVYAKSSISPAFLTTLGNSSYSIFLVHGVVLSVLKNIIDDRSLLTFMAFLVCCIGAGYLYYIYVEKPITSYAYKLLDIKK